MCWRQKTLPVAVPSSFRHHHHYDIHIESKEGHEGDTDAAYYIGNGISLANNPFILCISLATSTHLLIWTCHRSQCLQWIQTSMVLAVEQTTCDRVTVLLDLPGSPLLNGRGHGVKWAPFKTSARCVFPLRWDAFNNIHISHRIAMTGTWLTQTWQNPTTCQDWSDFLWLWIATKIIHANIK